VNLVRKIDALAPIGRHIARQYREERFPDPDAARTPEYPVDIGHHPLSLVEETPLAEFRIERNEKYDCPP